MYSHHSVDGNIVFISDGSMVTYLVKKPRNSSWRKENMGATWCERVRADREISFCQLNVKNESHTSK